MQRQDKRGVDVPWRADVLVLVVYAPMSNTYVTCTVQEEEEAVCVARALATSGCM